MFEHDLCLCMTQDCLRYKTCLRGAGLKREGIYTVSFLGTVCNKENGYPQYIEIQDADFKEVKEDDDR